jgi:hypothetical protein
MKKLLPALLCLIVLAVFRLRAADAPTKPSGPAHGLDMDYGPFLHYSILKPREPRPSTRPAQRRPATRATGGSPASVSKPPGPNPNPPWKPGDLLATKGVAVKLADNAAICFDTETLRYAAGWTGGYLDVSQTNLVRDQGPLPVSAADSLVFTTDDAPGWADRAGSFADPRPPNSDKRVNTGQGPLPKDWAHYRGLYRVDQRWGSGVIFSYTVGDVRVLDMPGCIKPPNGPPRFSRTLEITPHECELQLVVCSLNDGAVDPTLSNDHCIVMAPRSGGPMLAAQCFAGHLEVRGHSVIARIPPNVLSMDITLSQGTPEQIKHLAQEVRVAGSRISLASLTAHGGPAQWPQQLETAGTLGAPKDAYAVDALALPDHNPWQSWLKPTGFDFFSDGRLAFCTFNGDVWIVSGIDETLAHVKWKRFAAGLYEPLGLRIVDDTIHVLARDGIIKLHDLNNDGEADFYENFNNDLICDANYHSFHADLQTDREGNFYYAVGGNQMPEHKPDQRCVVKVSRYGDKAEVLCSGLRISNGLGVGANDEITVSDNQGHWVPASPIFLAKPGAFFGYHGDPRKVSKSEFAADIAQHPHDDPPICWIPYSMDNSSASQIWASKNFGPLSNRLLHLSYGKCTILQVLPEQVDGQWQGAAVTLPLKFDSGIMRARVNPLDGSLWVAGIRGWQTSANKDGCLQRIRYTGKPFYLPTSLHVTAKGIRVTFPVDLDPDTANDPGSYNLEAWTFHRSENYGSDDYKLSNPDEKGRDTLDVKSATLQPDKRTILIEVPDLKPTPQYMLKMRLSAADGTPVKADLGGSIWRISKE